MIEPGKRKRLSQSSSGHLRGLQAWKEEEAKASLAARQRATPARSCREFLSAGNAKDRGMVGRDWRTDGSGSTEAGSTEAGSTEEGQKGWNGQKSEEAQQSGAQTGGRKGH